MNNADALEPEKEPSHWEVITGSKKDQEDVREIETHGLGDPEEEELPQLTAGSGMVLRRGVRPIGVIFWDVIPVDFRNIKGNVMFILDLQVLKSERSAGISNKLVAGLKEYATKMKCDYVWWTAGSEDMDSISAKLARVSHDAGPKVGGVILPIEKLDMAALVNAFRMAKEKRQF